MNDFELNKLIKENIDFDRLKKIIEIKTQKYNFSPETIDDIISNGFTALWKNHKDEFIEQLKNGYGAKMWVNHCDDFILQELNRRKHPVEFIEDQPSSWEFTIEDTYDFSNSDVLYSWTNPLMSGAGELTVAKRTNFNPGWEVTIERKPVIELVRELAPKIQCNIDTVERYVDRRNDEYSEYIYNAPELAKKCIIDKIACTSYGTLWYFYKVLNSTIPYSYYLSLNVYNKMVSYFRGKDTPPYFTIEQMNKYNTKEYFDKSMKWVDRKLYYKNKEMNEQKEI